MTIMITANLPLYFFYIVWEVHASKKAAHESALVGVMIVIVVHSFKLCIYC